jgi:hypothetical protein
MVENYSLKNTILEEHSLSPEQTKVVDKQRVVKEKSKFDIQINQVILLSKALNSRNFTTFRGLPRANI